MAYQGGGDSVIFQNFQPVISILQSNQKMREAKAREEAKEVGKLSNEMAKDMAKTNSSGIREVDLPEFNKAMSDARDKYSEFIKSSSREERSKLQMEVNQYLSEAQRIKDLSKSTAERLFKADGNVINMVGKGRREDASSYVKSLKSKPSTSISEDQFDLSGFYYTYDETKRDKAIGTAIKNALTDPKSTSRTEAIIGTATTSGGKRYDTIGTEISVTPEKRLELISNLARTNKDVGNYVESLVQEGMDYNDALMQVVEDNSHLFSERKESRLFADKPSRGGITVNYNQLPEDMLGKQKTLKLGAYTTDKAWTYNKDVGLQGEIDFYDPDTGDVVAQSRSALDFKGYNIVVLPVDRYGNPIPDGSQRKAEGERTFMTGRVVNPETSIDEGAFKSEDKAFLKRDVIIPYEELDYVSMSKTQKGIVTSIDAQGEKPKTQSKNKVKFN